MRPHSRIALCFFLFAAFSQPAMSQEEAVSWTDQIKLYGDFRLREESIDEETFEVRDRSRFRARFGLDWTSTSRTR